MLNPWEVPPPPSAGDADEDTVFMAVGRALSRWEQVEINLAGLFGIIIGAGEDSIEARRAYGSVMSFKARSTMLQAAAEMFFEQRLLKNTDPEVQTAIRSAQEKFKSARTLCDKFSARRNEIAHGIVLPYIMFGGLNRMERTGYCLFPPIYNTNKSKLFGSPTYIYSSREIASFASGFEAALAQVSAVYIAFATVPGVLLPPDHWLNHQRL